MKIVYLPLCCVVLGAVGCSKKNDSQPQDSAAPYVRINAQFNGNQGQTFLNGYDASICTATVTTDPTSPTGLLFNFVAADPNGQQCEEVVSMERSKLKAGIVGTYTLGSDFYLTLKYHPAAGTTCTNSVFMYSSQMSMRTFTITAYDAGAKRMSGTFEAAAANVSNPAVCPITSQTQRGDMQATGEFKNMSVPF